MTRQYIITMNRGARVTPLRIMTTASRVSAAVRQVLDFEGAPFSSVLKVKCLWPVIVERTQ